MPVAARADSEYRSGTLCGGSRISDNDGSDDEHPASSLRHSEETAVENPPCHAVPEVGQRSKHDSEVPTAVRGEESGYVLKEYPSGSNSVDDPGELVEQPGSFACESAALSGDAEVLAGEAAAEKINGVPRPVPSSLASWPSFVSACVTVPSNVLYVGVDGDSGPMLGEHLAAPRIALTEELVSKPSPRESVVESADAGEEGTKT